MNQQKFQETLDKEKEVINKQHNIGTLSEKTLHRVVKNYLCNNEDNQEIKIGRYYVDIYHDDQIVEIQTKQFYKLKKKLLFFLENNYQVKIVFPTFYNKYLYWIEPETLRTTDKRLSPKKGSVYQVFSELYQIKSLLTNSNLSISIILMDLEEYRLLDGWSNNKKRGSHCYDRIPIKVIDEVNIKGLQDYLKLIPSNLNDQFTSYDFSKATKLTLKKSQIALNVLHLINIINRIGKQGRSYLYEKKVDEYE